MSHALANTTGGNDMKVLLLQQPKSFSNYPKWIEEVQECFDCLEVMVLTSNDRAIRHSWPNSVIKEIEVSNYSSDSATAEFFDVVKEFKPDRIISGSEEDVLRVAEARSLFEIPGLKYELALSCRDKVTMKQSALNAGLKIIPYTSCKCFGDIISAFDRWETVILKPRWGAGSAGITILHSKDDLSALAAKPEIVRSVHSNQYYLEEYCSGSVYHVDVVYINSGLILISPSRYFVPPLDFEKQNTGSVMLDENSADYSELLRLTKQLIKSFKDQTVPNVMHIEFYKNETGDFIFGEMAARRGGGLIKQELIAAYGVDQSKANFLLELGLVDANTNITRSSQYGMLLETAGLNWPKEKEIPDWAVLESVGRKKGITHNSVDSDRKFLISGNNEAEIIQRSNHLINS